MSIDIEDKTPYEKLDTSEEIDLSHNLENERIEAVLIKVNSTSSTFQIRVILAFCVFNFFIAVHSATFLFMFLSPTFLVESNSSQKTPTTSLESRDEFHACDKQYSVRVDFTSIASEFELYCTKAHVKRSAQGATLLLASIISLPFVMLQDRFGAKNIIVSCFLLMGIPGLVLMVFVEGPIAKIAAMVALWVVNDTAFMLTNVLINEYQVEPYRGASNVVTKVVYSIGAIVGTILTLYMPNYKQITAFHVIGNSLFIALLVFCLPHSVYYLLKQRKHSKLRETIVHMAKVNRLPMPTLQKILDNLDNVIRSTHSCFVTMQIKRLRSQSIQTKTACKNR